MTTPPPAVGGGESTTVTATDKFGFPAGWNYNDIWLDIVVILDTSEAMGATALNDAGALIESFISDGEESFLVTNPNAQFYSRVGVISMSDKAEVLYNLNMTKNDRIHGKASISRGVLEIDVVAAFEAALNMFNDGLKSKPERAAARQVVYYMTDSDPKNNLNGLNQFKASQGVIIVNNFLQTGEVELPGLKELASVGYYFSNNDYMKALRSFCKANCFCKPEKDALGGSDPAIKASGGCYHPAPAGVPFNKAEQTCEKQGGMLVSLHSEEKILFVDQLMKRSASPYYWVGNQLGDNGKWHWLDGSSMNIMNWAAYEPNQAANAKCAYVDSSTRKWGAGNCQLGFPYVCQYNPCSVGNKNC